MADEGSYTQYFVNGEIAHILNCNENGWTLMHPLACRPNLFDCPVNAACQKGFRNQRSIPSPGKYVCGADDVGSLYVGAFLSYDEAQSMYKWMQMQPTANGEMQMPAAAEQRARDILWNLMKYVDSEGGSMSVAKLYPRGVAITVLWGQMKTMPMPNAVHQVHTSLTAALESVHGRMPDGYDQD